MQIFKKHGKNGVSLGQLAVMYLCPFPAFDIVLQLYTM